MASSQANPKQSRRTSCTHGHGEPQIEGERSRFWPLTWHINTLTCHNYPERTARQIKSCTRVKMSANAFLKVSEQVNCLPKVAKGQSTPVEKTLSRGCVQKGSERGRRADAKPRPRPRPSVIILNVIRLIAVVALTKL